MTDKKISGIITVDKKGIPFLGLLEKDLKTPFEKIPKKERMKIYEEKRNFIITLKHGNGFIYAYINSGGERNIT